MVLNLLNLYSLIFALFRKIEGMSNELDRLQPKLDTNVTIVNENTYNNSESLGLYRLCFETTVPCLPCDMLNVPIQKPNKENSRVNSQYQSFDYRSSNFGIGTDKSKNKTMVKKRNLRYIEIDKNLTQNNNKNLYADEKISLLKEIERIHNLSKMTQLEDYNDTLETEDTESYDFNDDLYHSTDTTLITETQLDYKSSFSSLDSTYSEPNINSETNNKLPSITETFYSTETAEPQVFFIHSTLNTEVTFSAASTDSYQDSYTNADTAYTNIGSSSSSSSIFTDSYDITDTIQQRTPFKNSDNTITNEITSLDSTSEMSFTNDKIDVSTSTSISSTSKNLIVCPDLSFNYTINCGDKNITQIFYISNCTIIDIKCYVTICNTVQNLHLEDSKKNNTNFTMIDTVYFDKCHRKMYNLTIATKKKLLKLCWETMFGQELVKLTMMDLVSITDYTCYKLLLTFISLLKGLFFRFLYY